MLFVAFLKDGHPIKKRQKGSCIKGRATPPATAFATALAAGPVGNFALAFECEGLEPAWGQIFRWINLV